MNTLQNNGSGSSASTTNTTSCQTTSTVNTKDNATKQGKEAPMSAAMSKQTFPQVIPIAPNVVTLRAFRKMLLHRRRLVELAGVSVKNEEVEPATESDPQPGESDPQPGPSIATNTEEYCPQPHSSYPANVAASYPKTTVLEAATLPTRKEFQDSFDFDAISARFNALFLWPALLSAHSARIAYLRERQEAEKPPRKRKKKSKKSHEMLNQLSQEINEMGKNGSSVTAKRDVVTKNARAGMNETSKQSGHRMTRGFNDSATADWPRSDNDQASLRAEMMWNGIVREENVQTRTEMNDLDSRKHTVSKRKGQPKKLPQVKKEQDTATNVKENIHSNMKVKEETQRGRRVISRKKRRRIADISDESSSSESDQSDPDFNITKGGCYEPVAHFDLDTADPVLISKSSLRRKSKQII